MLLRYTCKRASSFSSKLARGISLLVVTAICCVPAHAAACQSQVVPSAPSTSDVHETYRLRVENARYGRVEVSLDGGKNYILLGRVNRPATAASPDKMAIQAGAMLRCSSDGMAFAVSGGYAVKILPASADLPGRVRSGPQSGGKAAEIVTSLSSDRGLFGKFLPGAGAKVMLQSPSHNPGPFPDGYSIAATDSFVVLANLPLPEVVGPPAQTDAERAAERAIDLQHTLRALFESMAAEYRDGALKRALADKRKIVTGTLTLRPNLPPDEPDPITAITYVIDESDNVVCARTTAPYLFAWDTTTVTDGEHVVEVRGLSAHGNVITRVRYLLVVNNAKAQPL